MKVRVTVTPYFANKLKRLLKKYATLSEELIILEDELLKKPSIGTSLGGNLYKIRLRSKQREREKWRI